MNYSTELHLALEALEAFAAAAADRRGPVIRQRPMVELARTLELDRLIAEGGLRGDGLQRFLKDYLAAATRLHHPGYMAHQVAVPHPMGALGSLIDGYLNNPMAIYEMGPSAATVEFAVLNWMLRKVGWRPAPMPGSSEAVGDHGGGVLTHGGSLANLTALMAALGRVAPNAWEEGVPRDLVVVAPEACHYSIARAVSILGLGRKALKAAPTDADGRLAPAQLGSYLRSLRQQGARILAVVANACSTAVGLYDPLQEIGGLCRDMGVWLHVDGAHGASALVSPRYRHLLDGVELADSLVWDAHKMLRTPTLCAAVLVRDHRDLDAAFHEEASYLFHDKDQPGIDLAHRTVECTKAALGLRLFLVLAAMGERGLADYVDRQTDLAAAVARRLRAAPGIEVAVEPQSNIICFRLDGADELQLAVRKRLLEDGRYYLSATEFRGRRWLRLALMNPVTDSTDIEGLLTEIRRHQTALG